MFDQPLVLEKEKEENMWRRKIFGQWRRRRKRGKYLKKENIWSAEEKQTEKEKETSQELRMLSRSLSECKSLLLNLNLNLNRCL